MCLDPALCISTPPIQGNLFSEQIGFGAEGFWASADAAITTGAGIDARLVSGVEAAFLTTTPKDGDQFPFTRLRIRIDIPLPGIYTVTHPWGKEVYSVATPGVKAVNDSFDIAFAADAVHQGRIGPILHWDSGLPITDAQGGQYIGDPATPHTVTGSPCGSNFFRIEAVALDGVTPLNIDPGNSDGIGGTSSVQTNLFNVSGKIFSGNAPAPLVVNRTNYTRAIDDVGQVNAFAISAPLAVVTLKGEPNLPPNDVPLDGDGQGLFFKNIPVNASVLPNSVEVTARNTGNADATHISLLTDLINITRAEYSVSANTLTIEANSSDQATNPILTVFGFDTLNNGSRTFNNVLVPPSRVTVTSAKGGSDSEDVTIVP
ncbi:hypothetical protein [Methylobacter sp.]|uniref:hypothetical protein n=1 Tax=Methylobacter sp. TaxID=2051955 RepID=UPI0011F8DE24|nr:hypothetical protein [Methylobacter sp.]TAK59663.1 MAG: hypothetical protein EPO18_20025 [Methylobacter sp.]